MKSNDVEVVFESDIEIEPAFIGAGSGGVNSYKPYSNSFLSHESRKRVQRRVVLRDLESFARESNARRTDATTSPSLRRR